MVSGASGQYLTRFLKRVRIETWSLSGFDGLANHVTSRAPYCVRNSETLQLMKAIILATAITISTGWLAAGQVTAPSDRLSEVDYSVIERGPHHRIMQRTTVETNKAGVVSTRVNSYTELATGLHYLAEDGQWAESREEIEILPKDAGAVARQGQHKVIFPPDIYDGAIQMYLPDGQCLRSRVLGLSYYDTASGKSVLIAETTNSVGELHGSNVVIYPEFLTDFRASLRLTYTKSGFEQDIILLEQPPSPKEWGMDPATTKLQVLTEFFDPPQPGKRELPVTDSKGNPSTDEVLDFPGDMQMGFGKAFSLLSGSSGEEIPVQKQWLKLEGRDFLVEQVEVSAIEKELELLPRGASLAPGTNAVRTARLGRPSLPARRQARATSKPMRMAQAPLPEPAFVLDYVTLNSSLTNYTFQGDTTYYFSGNVNLYGTNCTFEGGTVLKYTNNVTLTVNSPVNWLGDSYRPVVMVSRDDNTVGETILGSTGNPSTNYYAANALFFNAASANTNLVLQNLRVANATKAIAINTRAGHVLRNVQLLNCAYGLALTNAEVSLRNALMDRVRTNFTGSSSTGRVEHLTSDVAYYLNANIGTNLFLTNSLLVLVTNAGSYTGLSNRTITAASGVFTSVGAGYHYLAAGSTNRNAGTTNINAALLANLKKLTTYPPLVCSNLTFSTATNFNPQLGIRDTSTNDLPDIGYHYDPLDYLINNLSLTSTLTLTNGVAVAVHGNYGINLSASTGKVVSHGTPNNLNVLTRYQTVQEQPVTLSGGTPVALLWPGITGSGTPTVSLRFTDVPVMSGSTYLLVNYDGTVYSVSVSLQDCQLRGSGLYVFGGTYYGITVALTNNLVERGSLTLSHYADTTPNSVNLRNNLFWRSSVSLTYFFYPGGPNPTWSIQDNAFDNCVVYEYGDGYQTYIQCSTNGWVGTGVQLYSTGGADVTPTTFNYATNTLGRWYQSSTNFINKGSRTADLAGLYHYTTQTNQVKETNSVVDIGFHYVAVNASGLPYDFDGDGIPDYVEDANGNGTVDAGETEWRVVITNQPQSQVVVAGNSVTFTVGATGTPLFYQWLFNNTNAIAGATSNSYTIGTVSLTNAGLYSVIVSNANGMVLSSNATLTVNCYSTPSGLVAWWQGESSPLDSVSNYHGVFVSGSYTNSGYQNKAFQFDGTNSYVVVRDQNAFALTNLTIEAWVKFDSLTSAGSGPPDGQQYIVFKQNSRSVAQGNFEGFWLGKYRSGSSDYLLFAVSSATGTYVSVTNTTPVQTNVWYHIAGVRGSNFIRLHVNGQMTQQATVGSAQDYGIYPLYFGTSGQTGYDRKFKGKLDEVSIYNRALATNEITSLYKAGGKCAPTLRIIPPHLNALTGNAATFAAVGSGGAPLSYQWRFNNTNLIAGASNAILPFASLQTNNSGNYSVTLSNLQGVTTSSEALLVSSCFPMLDIMLVIDRSGSMLSNIETGITRYQGAKIAASNFVANLNTNYDQCGLVHFSDYPATNSLTLTNQLLRWNQAIQNVPNPAGYTYMSDALLAAHAELNSVRRNSNALPVIVFLSDGQPTDLSGSTTAAASNLVVNVANELKARGSVLFTVALSSEADTNFMRYIASSTNFYYAATNLSQLTNVYLQIAGNICRGSDPTNQSPIVSWVTPANNQLFVTSPTNILLQASNSGGATITAMLYYNDTNYLGQATNAPYQFLWENVTFGSYNLKAIGINAAGASAPALVTNIIVNAMPVVTITAPTNLQPGFVEVTNITLRAGAIDPDGTIVSVRFYTNLLSTNFLTAGQEGVTTNYSTPWNGRTDDYYAVTAVATDNRGAQTTSPLTVFQVTPTNPPPVVWITYPTNNEVFRPGADITITASATNWPATVTNVEFFANDRLLGNDSDRPYSITVCCWETGKYQLVAKATDSLGSSTVSTNVTIIVGPSVPTSGEGYWDPEIGNPGFSFFAYAVTVHGPNIYVGGDRTNDPFINSVGRWDGTNWLNMSGGDFAVWVYDFAVDGSNIYAAGKGVSGTFPKIISHWDGSDWQQLGNNSLNFGGKAIHAVAVIGSDIFVGGDFADESTNVQYIARLNPTNLLWEPIGNGLNGPVHALASIGNRLFAGGEFTNAGTNSNANYIAELVGGVWTNLGTGLAGTNSWGNPGAVYALAVCDHDLFVGGDFTTAGGNTNANGIAKWDGEQWTTIHRGLAGGDNDGPVRVYSITPQGRTTLYIGGNFESVWQGTNIIPASNIAKATWSDAAQDWIWTDLDQGLSGRLDTSTNYVWSTALMPGPTPNSYDLFVAGDFSTAGSAQIISSGVARWRVGYQQPSSVPVVTITNPVSFAAFSNNPSLITVEGKATSSYTNITKLELFTNGVFADTFSVSPPGTPVQYAFTPFELAAGLHSLKVVATDEAGSKGASSLIYISVKDTNSPVSAVSDQFTIIQGAVTNLNVLANDSPATGLRVAQINDTGVRVATIQPGHDGTYVRYEAPSNLYGQDSFNYVVTNSSGISDVASVSVKIRSKPGVWISSPGDGKRILTNVNLTITGAAWDWDGTATNVTLYVNGAPQASMVPGPVGNITYKTIPDALGVLQAIATPDDNYSFTWTMNQIGFYTLMAMAVCDHGITNWSAPVTVTLTNTVSGNTPSAQIANLVGTTNFLGNTPIIKPPLIAEGLFDLTGTATGASPVGYQVLLYRPEDWEAIDELSNLIGIIDPYANITPTVPACATNYQGFRLTNGVNINLGTLDLTSIPNGIYDLVLRVRGGTDETNAIVRVQIESNLKIGQFSFSEQDLVLPVNGIPITITRTYNSLNQRTADFGYSWTYALNSMDVQLDETRTDATMGSDAISLDPFEEDRPGLPRKVSVRTGGSRDVTLTLPDGRRTTFVFKPQFHSADMYADAKWEAPPGVTETLERYNDSGVINLPWTAPPFWQTGGDNSTFNNHDLAGWVLTTLDGTKYYITRGTGELIMWDENRDGTYVSVTTYDAQPKLTAIVQRSGDRIQISDTGVEHYAPGTNTPSRSMFMQRDSAGRVVAIFDPNSGVTDDASAANAKALVKYVYNRDTGNLIQVQRLQDRVAGTYLTTKYHYDHPKFPHYITSIEDPRGIPLARNEYDDSGKLTAVVDADGKRTEFGHDTNGRFERVIDRLGNTNTFVYDTRGNVIITTNAVGMVSTNGYDGYDNKTNEVVFLNNQPYATNRFVYDTSNPQRINLLLASINALGHSNTFVYGQNARLEVSTDARGFSTTNYYDTNTDLLIATSDALGNVTSNYYDLTGNRLLLGTRDAVGTLTTNKYDSDGNLIGSMTYVGSTILSTNSYAYDANGNQTNSVTWRRVNGVWTGATNATIYDAQNRVVQSISPEGGTNITVYNSLGKQDYTVDALNHTTHFAYDAQGRMWQTTYVDGTTNSSYFDAEGRTTNSVNRADRGTTNYYDALGRMTHTVFADNTTNRTVYDGLGRVAYSVDARGTTNAFGYDVLGRRIAVTNAWGTSVAMTNFFGYDVNGNQPYITNALGVVTTNYFDALNRVTNVLYADGSKTFTGYDAVGRRVAETNQDNIVTRFGYDGAGRLIAVTNAFGVSGQQTVTRYEYDEAGNQVAQIDALLRTNRYAYDNMGRRILHTMPDPALVEGFAYDKAGNLLWHTNFNGIVITNQYDVLNRLTSRTSTNGYSVTYGYSVTGQRTNMTDASGTTSYAYDVRDRLTNCVSVAGTLNYLYDENGNLTNLASTTADGTSISYQYDALNRLTNVIDARLSGSQNTGYRFDLLGNLQRLSYPNGVTNLYQYDALNRLTNLTWKYNGNARADFTYKLGSSGNRTNLTEAIVAAPNISRTYTWQYDALYRLTNETTTGTTPTGSLGYGYDPVGNRTNRTVTGTLGLTNQTPTFNTNDWVKSDAYDNNGNTRWTTNGTLQGPYNYDVENRLTNFGNITITYNGDGQRVKKVVGSTTTLYVVDSLNPSGYAQVLEELTAGVATNFYTYGLDLISQRKPGVTNFYGYDGHGSTKFLLTLAGGVSDTYMYDAYGTRLDAQGTTANNYLYCGEQWDADLGFYYLRARYLSPGMGRFWTMDSYAGENEDPLSLHKYLYGAAGPVNGYDPSGHNNLTEQQVTTFLMFVGLTMNGANALRHIYEGNYKALTWDAAGIALSLAGGSGGGGGLTLGTGGATLPFAANFSRGAIITAQGGSLALGGAGLITAMNQTTPATGRANPPSEGPYHNQKPNELAEELKWVDEAGIKPAEAGTQEFWDILRDNPVVKWAVTEDGNLKIVPYKINIGRIAKEIPHTAITRGKDAWGAGEASMPGGVGKLLFNKQSGHYTPANYSPGEIAFKATGLKVEYVNRSLVP